MCEDNTVSGSKVYADSGDIGLSILPCNCYVQANNGDVLSIEVLVQPTDPCGTSMQFINFATCGPGSTPLATDIPISNENYNESLTLEKQTFFFGEITDPGYCIAITITGMSTSFLFVCIWWHAWFMLAFETSVRCRKVNYRKMNVLILHWTVKQIHDSYSMSWLLRFTNTLGMSWLRAI